MPTIIARPKLFSSRLTSCISPRAILAALTLSLTAISSTTLPTQADPLQGGVQELGATEAPANLTPIVPMSAPVLKKRKPLAADAIDNSLKGNADDSGHGLSGQAQDDGDAPMKSQKATLDGNGPLKATLSNNEFELQSHDADSQDQEMAVEWDRWRNRLLRSIQGGVQELINNPENMLPHFDERRGVTVLTPRIPLGQKASFYVRISDQRRVVKARIIASSGNSEFDNALLDAIYALDGTTILRFPKGSQRPRVVQEATIITADHGNNEFFKFGDVEKFRKPNQ
ncbi:hypothetical protein BH11CYA1_BH11CYA1_37230 [soil metagenome]